MIEDTLDKMMKQGSWWLTSKSDSRWNCHGQGSVGMFAIPADAQEFMDKKKKELNEEPPKDLEFGYMKD